MYLYTYTFIHIYILYIYAYTYTFLFTNVRVFFSNHVYTYIYAYVYVRTGPHSTVSKNLHRKTQLDVVITFHGIICLGSMYPRSYINPGSSFHFLWICTLIFMGSHTLSQSELHLRAIFNWPGSSTYNLASFTSSTYRFAFSSHFFLWFMQSESTATSHKSIL